ncbi:DUF4199 domain-containing protein [Chitinophaga qingshengii]|uniref:DUF4199 domain-containing protein n=1 Tax=Chitinophaga qingshengii TaxID=1569794 RepID=A0ABR7TVP8_9BACT|nr:DUF4199 domain-containing protein [Chitinophaga qingshengii]MBC9934502.1 DUF4199 domain-containing protein [Chitinophaga qingshengii]
MKKNVLVFGLIAGAIVSLMMVFSVIACYNDPNYMGNMFLGYAGMLVAFSFIFIGIKNYRDKYNNKTITFGKAFKVGLLIALVASTIYVVVWLFDFYLFVPDFMDKYSAHVLKTTQDAGADAATLSKKAAEMEQFRQWYKNPLMVILITYWEVLPIGAAIALISALILKRKKGKDTSSMITHY